MSRLRLCDFCGNSFPISEARCPHCGRPGLFPNVYAAEDADEHAALERRYLSAKQSARSSGSGDVFDQFENAATNSQAVIARPAGELQRLATSDRELYATFYQLRDAGVRLPAGEKWDTLRAVADEMLFSGYKEQIRFAALSLDGVGLINYGDCSITLRAEMIAHRASVFEENSVLFMDHHDIMARDAHRLPQGHRATWDGRGKLCALKLAAQFKPETTADEFPQLLLRQGASSEDDDFVEVHIWGPMTIRSIKRAVFTLPRRQRTLRGVIDKANRRRLEKFGVEVQVR